MIIVSGPIYVDAAERDSYLRSCDETIVAARGSDGRKFPWGDEPGDALHMNAAGLEWTRWETSKKLPTSEPHPMQHERPRCIVLRFSPSLSPLHPS